MRRRPSRRMVAFLCIVVSCVGAAGAYVSLAVARAHRSSPPPGIRVVTGASLAPTAAARPTAIRTTQAVSMNAARGPQILFVNMIPDNTIGKLAVAPLSKPNSSRAVADLKCERAYYAAGRGICVARAGVVGISYVAKIFNANFRVLREVDLPGIPSRARVSPNGRYGATTMFVRGDSYAGGNFSTRTAIIDLTTGRIVADLEKVPVTKNGKRFSNRNFNFWGVTFTRDGDRYYATLGSGSKTYLLQGSIRKRTLRVIHERVECPSLSPDGRRIAFKRVVSGGKGNWRLFVLDLETMRETRLAGRDPVDDQPEWLDNRNVLYATDNTIWRVPADGSGRPRQLVSYAFSPAVVRTR